MEVIHSWNTPSDFMDTFIHSQLIGSGCDGNVFKLTDVNGKCNAYKLFRSTINKDITSTQICDRITQIQKLRSQSPYFREIYQIHSFKNCEYSYGLLMEWRDGISIYNWLYPIRGTKFPLNRLIAIVKHIIQVLKDLHKSGLYHDDLSDKNVVIDLEIDQITIIDFEIDNIGLHNFTDSEPKNDMAGLKSVINQILNFSDVLVPKDLVSELMNEF